VRQSTAALPLLSVRVVPFDLGEEEEEEEEEE